MVIGFCTAEHDIQRMTAHTGPRDSVLQPACWQAQNFRNIFRTFFKLSPPRLCNKYLVSSWSPCRYACYYMTWIIYVSKMTVLCEGQVVECIRCLWAILLSANATKHVATNTRQVCTQFERYTMYIDKCTMYIARCTMYIARCTMYIAKCTMYIAKCTMYIAKCTIHIVKCLLLLYIHIANRAMYIYIYIYSELNCIQV